MRKIGKCRSLRFLSASTECTQDLRITLLLLLLLLFADPSSPFGYFIVLGSNHLVVSARQYISDYNLVLRHYYMHLMAARVPGAVL
jgi:hypothetical protein